jgi:hypothetical protein
MSIAIKWLWQGRQDLNLQPAVLETAALPVVLWSYPRTIRDSCDAVPMPFMQKGRGPSAGVTVSG